MPNDTPVVPDANAQAKAALPKPEYMAPAEDLAQGTKFQTAYDAAKNWLGEHEQHLSEEYLKPFRQGLDNMAADLENAGETGHTKSGGQLTGPARALASGAGAALKMVPVGKDVKETALMAATNLPELPEGHIFSDIEGVAPHPEQIIKDAGLVYKGEMVPTSKLHMFEHPDHPGKTASLFEHEISADAVKSKMDSKIKEFEAGEKAKQISKNASGESAASQEAINRAASEKSKGETYHRIDTRSGKETPIIGADRVDAKAGPYEVIVKRGSKGDTTLDSGAKSRLLSGQSKTDSAAPKLGQKQKVSKEDSKLASDYLATLTKPIKFGDKVEPRNESKIVIEGVDEPAKNPEGRYSDKNKYDPWSPNYKKRAGAPEPVKRA